MGLAQIFVTIEQTHSVRLIDFLLKFRAADANDKETMQFFFVPEYKGKGTTTTVRALGSALDIQRLIAALNKERRGMFLTVSQVLFVGTEVVTQADIMKALKEHNANEQVFRLQCQNTDIKDWLLRFEESNITVSPTKYSHVLSIVGINHAEKTSSLAPNFPTKCVNCMLENTRQESAFCYQHDELRTRSLFSTEEPLYLFGIQQKEEAFFQRPTEKETYQICRASLKIKEAVEYYCLDDSNVFSAKGTALDIGAAPGGWTLYLSERFSKVIAVDPAPLADCLQSRIIGNSPKDASQNIIFISKHLQNCIEDLHKYSPFQVICSDATMSPNDIPVFISKLLPFLAENGFAVITLKLQHKPGTGKLLWSKNETSLRRTFIEAPNVAKTVLSRINEEGAGKFIGDCVWLFANSENERTLILKKVTCK